MKRGMKLLALLTVLALFAAACGDDDGGDDTTAAPPATQATTQAPPATTSGGGETTQAPETTSPPAAGVSCDEPVTVGVITDQTGALAIYGSHVNRGVPIGFAYATGTDVQGNGLSMAEQTYMLEDCEIRVPWGEGGKITLVGGEGGTSLSGEIKESAVESIESALSQAA